jgi:hypothetical protein
MQAMNKIYRLVWNARKTAGWQRQKSHAAAGPRAATVRSAAILSLLGGSLLAQAATPQPSVTPTGGNTRSYTAANGATVVDIATANAAGVSSNQYTQYNVNSQGLVLNNGNTSQLSRQSQLAGQVYANVNLGNQASLILNQGQHQSQHAGRFYRSAGRQGRCGGGQPQRDYLLWLWFHQYRPGHAQYRFAGVWRQWQSGRFQCQPG